jgi:hypothetical protein
VLQEVPALTRPGLGAYQALLEQLEARYPGRPAGGGQDSTANHATGQASKGRGFTVAAPIAAPIAAPLAAPIIATANNAVVAAPTSRIIVEFVFVIVIVVLVLVLILFTLAPVHGDIA